MKRFEITDDSGFLAVVNADRYKTFVTEDWELKELMDHFIAEMNNDNLVIWGTGLENYWKVDFVDASYAHRTLPEKHSADDYVELPNGLYNLTIRQLCDPNHLDLDNEIDPGFEVSAVPADAPTRVEGIFWWKM